MHCVGADKCLQIKFWIARRVKQKAHMLGAACSLRWWRAPRPLPPPPAARAAPQCVLCALSPPEGACARHRRIAGLICVCVAAMP